MNNPTYPTLSGVESYNPPGARIRILLYGFAIILALAATFVIDIAIGDDLRNLRALTASRLDPDAIALCSNLPAANDAREDVPDGKIGVVDVVRSVIYKDYQDALGADRQPEKPGDAVAVLCLTKQDRAYGSPDEYTESSTSSKVVYTCTRYTRDLVATLVDTKTKAVVSTTRFRGRVPDECPARASSNLTRYGELPPVASIAQYIR